MRIAWQHIELGDSSKALELLEPLLARVEKLPDLKTNMSAILTVLATAQIEHGDLVQAEKTARRVIALDREIYGGQAPPEDYVVLAEALAARRQFDAALDAFRTARRDQAKAVPNAAASYRILTGLGRVLLARRDPEAIAILEEAVKLAETREMQPYRRGLARFALAQAIDNRARARTLATAARADFAEAFARGARQLPNVDAWLRAHP